VEARCAQCGTLWQIDASAVERAQPYQCNACGHVFTIALEGTDSMQIRHTNGKVYKVKDLATLVRWVGEKRVPRQCMLREDEGEWQQAMEVPEIAEAFTQLDARRTQIPQTPVEPSGEPAPAEVPAEVLSDDEKALEAAAAELAELDMGAIGDGGDGAALEAALEADFAVDEKDPAEVENQLSAGELDEVDHSFDDAFDLLEEMTHEPSDVPGLTVEAAAGNDEEAAPKKSKMPMFVAVVALIAGAAYFATQGGGSGGNDPLMADTPEGQALRAAYDKGLEALASGESKRMLAAMNGLEPAMCLGDCKGSQCLTDDKGVCGIDTKAASFAPFFLLYDRLWLEANQSDSSLQGHAGLVLKTLQASAEKPFGKERLGAFADHWNALSPAVDENSNKAEAALPALSGALPAASDTPIYISLKQLEGEAIAEATKLLAVKTVEGKQPADARLLNLARARLARGEVATKGCGPVSEAYLAAVKAGLPAVRRELALFLATHGDLKGAALALGASAGDDPLLQAINAASKLTAEADDNALKAKFARQNKATMKNRKKKKTIKFLYKQLARNNAATDFRGRLLAGIQEMFPNALKELMESAWIAVQLGQAAKAEEKAAFGAEAMKRFDRVLAVDANRRDALLGRAAAALLTGQGKAHRVDAYTWLFSQKGADKALCAAPNTDAKEASK
jgi:hypothetical protein